MPPGLVILSLNFGFMAHTVLYEDSIIQGSREKFDLVLNAKTKTINELLSNGHQVLLVASPPVNGQNLGLCLANSYLMGQQHSRNCSFKLSEINNHEAKILSEIGKMYPIFKLRDLICKKKCVTPMLETFGYTGTLGIYLTKAPITLGVCIMSKMLLSSKFCLARVAIFWRMASVNTLLF